MDWKCSISLALRGASVVAIVGLGLILVSTSTLWGVLLGFALLYVAIMVSVALRLKNGDLTRGQRI